MESKQSRKRNLCRVCGYTNQAAASSIEERCGGCGIGLSEAAANALLLKNGRNELARQNQRTEFWFILDDLGEPMLALMIVGFVVYRARGDVKEAIILLGFACLSALIWRMAFSRQRYAAAHHNELSSPWSKTRSSCFYAVLRKHSCERFVFQDEMMNQCSTAMDKNKSCQDESDVMMHGSCFLLHHHVGT